MLIVDESEATRRVPFNKRIWANLTKAIGQDGVLLPCDGPTHFQKVALETGSVKAICPWSNEVLEAEAASFLSSEAIAYRFNNFYVVTGLTGQGYPKCAMYLPKDGQVATLQRYAGQRLVQNLAGLIESQVENDGFFPTRGRKYGVFFGHPNFAHVLWNEFSQASEFLTSEPYSSVAAVVESKKPLGPLSEIFSRSHYRHVEMTGRFNEFYRSEELIPLRLGGRQLTEQATNQLMTYLEREVTQKARELRQKFRKPTIFVTVRTVNRTPSNQRELLIAIFGEIRKSFPNALVIWVGFSPPYGGWGVEQRDSARAEIERANTEIDQIERTLGFDSIKLIGWSVLDVLWLSRSADYYFSHHGTMQNMLSWISGIPGMVHSNSTVLRSPQNSPKMAELAVQPAFVPAVEDIISPGIVDDGRGNLQLYKVDVSSAIAEMRRHWRQIGLC